MKIFISQPMGGLKEDEIKAERESIIETAKYMYGEDIEVLDTYFEDYDGTPLQFLAKSLDILSQADVAVFAKGYEKARGCRIEEACCRDYGIKRLLIQ